MAKHVYVKALTPSEQKKQADADKITRLRALRLAKEAADKDAANREVTAPLPRSRRAHPPKAQPLS